MEKLTEKEWKFCKKLRLDIMKMSSLTEQYRQDIINYIIKKCNKKYKCEIQFKMDEKDYKIYEFKLNEKINYLVFDVFGKQTANIVPAGCLKID